MSTEEITKHMNGNVKKYGIKALLVAVALTIIPYLDSYIKEYMATQQTKITKNLLSEHRVEVLEKVEVMLNQNRKVAIDAHGKKKLTDDQALYLVKVAVGFQSIHKVEFIENLLNQLPPEYLTNNKDRVENTIRVELVRQSSVYINGLNKFVHPVVGNLGDYVQKEFPMQEFLQAVYLVVLDESIEDVFVKGDWLMDIMLDFQNDLLNRMKKEMDRSSDLKSSHRY